MRGWIYNADLEGYKSIMISENATPVILDQNDFKSLVQMTVNCMQVWMMTGKHFEYA